MDNTKYVVHWYNQTTRCNSNNFIDNYNQLIMFQAIISPILRMGEIIAWNMMSWL